MHPEVVKTIREAANHFCMMDELQDKVGELIAEMVHAEAATVTSGAFSAMTLGLAGILTGLDLKKVEQLPHLQGTGMKTEVICQKSHDERYNHAFLNTGCTIVTVETLAELENAMVSAGRANDANMFTVQSAAKVSSLEKQMKVTMLTTLYGELVKNLELSKTMAAREEPLITIIDRPHYPLRVRESGLKGALFGGVIGGFLTVLFFAGREFLRDLNKQAQEAQRG